MKQVNFRKCLMTFKACIILRFKHYRTTQLAISLIALLTIMIRGVDSQPCLTRDTEILGGVIVWSL